MSLGAAVNLSLNFILIPRYGMAGAAWSTFLGFATQMSTTLILSLRVYHVPYPYWRMAAMVGTALAVYGASVMVDTHSLAAAIAIKAPLMLLFPVALLSAGLFDPKDLAALLTTVERRVPRAAFAIKYLRPLVLRGRDTSPS